MKNDISIDPKQLVKGTSSFIYRFHVLIFALVVLGGLSAATFVLYQTVVSSQSAEVGNTQAQFDKATMDKIKTLRASDDNGAPLEKPAGRSNPFKE